MDINWLNFITWKKPIDQQHRRHSRINCRVILTFSRPISLALSQTWFPILCGRTLRISLYFSLRIAGEQQFRCVYTIVPSSIPFYSIHRFIFIHHTRYSFNETDANTLGKYRMLYITFANKNHRRQSVAKRKLNVGKDTLFFSAHHRGPHCKLQLFFNAISNIRLHRPNFLLKA